MARIYYGWWIVGACLLAAMIGNALGLFGAGVYLRAITTSTGWATGTVSGAVTLFYVVSAILLIRVGSGDSGRQWDRPRWPASLRRGRRLGGLPPAPDCHSPSLSWREPAFSRVCERP
jgi:hypothetical protein